jgi:hypothetical protein
MRFLLVFNLTVCLLQNFYCATSSNLKNRQPFSISEEDAVRRAEEFIVLNGYTDLPPTEDSLKITHESLEWSRNYSELMKFRHNTLEREAYGISKIPKGWAVVFRFKNAEHSAGRAVTISTSGGNLFVQHQDSKLDAVEKKLKHLVQ